MKTPHIAMLALMTLGCREEPPYPGPPVTPEPDPLDVTVRLGPGEVRAGVVTDPTALFGGVSAEGQPGDVKLYNDRVQVIIQGVRESNYYEIYGGGLIDADLVRPEGEPGRDVLDEMSPMVGLGRLLPPDSVEVVADGSDGAAAIVRVTSTGGPMELLTGALESPNFVEDYALQATTDYILEPDTWLVRVRTELTWKDVTTEVQMGDIAMVGVEVTDGVLPGRGLERGEGRGTGDWLGLVGRNNEVAVAILSDGEPFAQGAIEVLLQELGPVLAGLGPSTTLNDGDQVTFERWVGVGPDLATVTGAWRAARGEPTTTVGGTVTADGAPVAGARVHVLGDDGTLETLAHTDDDGRWTADVVARSPTAIATGRGHANLMDLPSGAGWVAPYAHEVAQDVALDSLEVGASGVPFAEGYGQSDPATATADTALTLTPPGTIDVTIADGGPAVVRVDFSDDDPATADRTFVPGRPSGAMAWGYVRDGDLQIPVEPGDYRLTIHRGLSYEPVVTQVTVGSGEQVPVTADLVRVLAPPGVLAIDPHTHASPSGDGDIAMAHRLMTSAANGVQVHFGTDHDHVADYRPLLAPLGLTDWLQSVVADEVSPILRGHFNLYPLTPDATLPNNGAPRWWSDPGTTDALYAEALAFAGDDAVLQLNHPWGSTGMLDLAGYDLEDGEVSKGDFWSDRFTAMEVLNDGAYDEYLPLYLDLVARGHDVTPVGVSDAHGYRNGIGENLTWLHADLDDPQQLTDAILKDRFHDQRTVVSRGPFLDARIDGAWAPGQTVSGPVTLEVDVQAASFVQVDRLLLLENGETVETVPWAGAPVSFSLAPDADAFYVVIAEGDERMAPVYTGRTPWAMTAAIKVDVDGGRWTPPKPPLQIGD